MKNIIKLLLLTVNIQAAMAEKLTFTSGKQQTTLIELYSSEGCSSCPPADQFISRFKNSDQLWEKFIPMVFHVDYWDYLGWKDAFAAAEFSNRQRQHKQQGNLSSVYTPGFVVNGEEWTEFFKPYRYLPEFNQLPGRLGLTIDRHQVTINFTANQHEYVYNLAILGMGISNQVNAGENTGKILIHDFVVLDHQQRLGQSSITMNLPLIVNKNSEQFAVVAWITLTDSLKPIQATGGLLPKGIVKQL
jgi:hypothetical protein